MSCNQPEISEIYFLSQIYHSYRDCLITLKKTPSLHSEAEIFLASLALSVLRVGLVVQPLYITLLLNKSLNSRFEIVILWFFTIFYHVK